MGADVGREGGWPPRKSLIRWASAALIVLVGLGVWLFIANRDDLDHISVSTDGMEPAIPAGARVAWDRHAYESSAPEVGEVVLFRATPSALRTCSDSTAPALLIKRVVGVAGDQVSVERGGGVSVNGTPLADVKGGPANYSITWSRVPPGKLLVLGDNLPGSCDSHLWRPDPFVPVANVVGRVQVD